MDEREGVARPYVDDFFLAVAKVSECEPSVFQKYPGVEKIQGYEGRGWRDLISINFRHTLPKIFVWEPFSVAKNFG